MVVLFTTTALLAVETSNDTIAPVAKFVPVIVTFVPPLPSPVAGLMDATVAPGGGVVTGPPVVKLQIGPTALRLAMVLETIFHR
jgi:hypothetical protein